MSTGMERKCPNALLPTSHTSLASTFVYCKYKSVTLHTKLITLQISKGTLRNYFFPIFGIYSPYQQMFQYSRS